ncbi:MAG: preprotein translocase subunit YajC [Verrucomicrobiales bacterium]|nr:preprotein translocase subunit YajC [Verrucomicrobiales bacterium]
MNTQIYTILAADAAPAANPMGGMMIPMVLLLVMMYFVMIRPQQKKAKEQTKMIDGLKIGDEVITAGGIHGIVTNKSDRTVTVKVQDGVKIKFEKASVTQVFSKDKDKGGKATEVEAEVIEEKKTSKK